MATTKAYLRLRATHAKVVESSIQHWLESNDISEDQAKALLETIVTYTFDWERFAKYTLRLAVLCLVVAVASIVLQESFLRLYRRIVALPPALRGFGTALIAVAVHGFAYRRSQNASQQKYVNEGIHGVGSLCFALAAFQVLEQLHASGHEKQSIVDTGSHSKAGEGDDETAKEGKQQERERRSRLVQSSVIGVLLGLATIYAAVALISGSNLIWSCAMIVLGYCCGGMADYWGGTYSLGMDSPAAFIGFGSFLTGISSLMRTCAITEPLWSTTRAWGLIYLFLALWVMSLFGYDQYLDNGGHARALSPRLWMFLWSLVFFVAAMGCTWHGLRYDDSTTKGFGLTFLGINLYTKFFEYCWGYPKAVFFAVLAASFAIVGKYAEGVWNMQVADW